MPEGRQSPPPEKQTAAQVNAPAHGQGVDDAKNKEQTNKEQLENLASNPKGPIDDTLKDKFSKQS